MKLYNKTIEDLEAEYADKPEDKYWFHQQAVLGSVEDAKKAYDENGNFHCIHWFDCRYCPAFHPQHCV